MRRFFWGMAYSFAWSSICFASPHAETATTQRAHSTQHSSKPSLSWYENDIDSAIKAAQSTQKPILVSVYANWCPPCKQLAYEVFQSTKEQTWMQAYVRVRIHFDSPKGRAATKNYRILGLPTTLLLSPKGHELGRIVGYTGRTSFVQTVRDIRSGKNEYAAIVTAYKKMPQDPRTIVDYAQAQLVRGQIKIAHTLLRSVYTNSTSQHRRSAQRAARIWGRYLLRVQRDGVRGTQHFLDAMKRFKNSPAFKGFLYWAAKGYALQKKPKQALQLFELWSQKQPNSISPLVAKASFMLHHKYISSETFKLLQHALQKQPRNAWLHYMLAQVHQHSGRIENARSAIRHAIRLAPKRAIFHYYAKKLK